MADDLAEDWWESKDVGDAYSQEEPEEDLPKKTEVVAVVKSKRKRDDGQEGNNVPTAPSIVKDAQPIKTKKQRRKEHRQNLGAQFEVKQKEQQVRASTKTGAYSIVLEQVQASGQYSEIELEGLLKESYFTVGKNTGDEHLGEFVQSVVPGGATVLESTHKMGIGRVRVIVLTSSAPRAVDIVRFLTQFQPGTKIGKFFARHKKMDGQASFLEQNSCIFAVATPNRMSKLIEQGKLDISYTKLFVLDSTFLDKKKRTIWEQP